MFSIDTQVVNKPTGMVAMIKLSSSKPFQERKGNILHAFRGRLNELIEGPISAPILALM